MAQPPSSTNLQSSHETSAGGSVGVNTSRSRANTHHLQLPHVPVIQNTASQSPPPPYVPLPPVNGGGPNSISNSDSGSQGPVLHLQGHYLSSGITPGTPHVSPIPNPLLHPYFSHQHQHFGPTPLSTTVPLLPYAHYEPPGAADIRARKRFVRSVMVAFGVWLLVSVIIALEVLGEVAWW